MIDTYLNGMQITDSNDGNEGQIIFENTANFMDIGRWETDSEYISAHIDDFRLFSNALTEQQIESIYNNEFYLEQNEYLEINKISMKVLDL